MINELTHREEGVISRGYMEKIKSKKDILGKGIAFEIAMDRRNAEMIDAIKEVQAMKRSVIRQDVYRC
jgi:hypothetical protein